MLAKKAKNVSLSRNIKREKKGLLFITHIVDKESISYLYKVLPPEQRGGGLRVEIKIMGEGSCLPSRETVRVPSNTNLEALPIYAVATVLQSE